MYRGRGAGGKGPISELCALPPGIAPRLWCTAEQRDKSVKTMSLPSSPSSAPGQAWRFPLGTPALRRRAPQGGDASEGAAALAAPRKIAWPGAGAPVVLGPAPGVPRALYCVLHCVLCCVLHCVPHCVLCCVLHCVLHCALHCVLCLHCVPCCVLHSGAHCVLHPVVHCVLHPAVHCVLHPVVLCVQHPVVHCALHPVVHCVPCSVLAVHVHRRGAVRSALHTVLLALPGAVHCLLFPVPLHPALPDLPALSALRGGGGVRVRNGGGDACPPVLAGQPRCCRKHPAAPQRPPLVGKGGGGLTCCCRARRARSARTSGRGHHVAVG